MTPADILTDAERSALAEACDRVARAQRMARIEAAGHSAVKVVAAGAICFLAGLLISESLRRGDVDSTNRRSTRPTTPTTRTSTTATRTTTTRATRAALVPSADSSSTLESFNPLNLQVRAHEHHHA